MTAILDPAAAWTTEKILAIRDLAAATTHHVRKALPKIYSRELVDVLFEQPYCRIANLVEARIVKRQSASTYLGQLVDTSSNRFEGGLPRRRRMVAA